MNQITNDELIDVAKDYPVNIPFYYRNKCYVVDEQGELIELGDLPEKTNRSMRKDLHVQFVNEANSMIWSGCRHNGNRTVQAMDKISKKIKHAIEGDFPNMYFDFAQIPLSHSMDGNYMQGVSGFVLELFEDAILLSWDTDCEGVVGVGQDDDHLMVMIFNMGTQDFSMIKHAAFRMQGGCILDVGFPGDNDKLDGWVFFVSDCGNYVSQTTYLGSFSRNELK